MTPEEKDKLHKAADEYAKKFSPQLYACILEAYIDGAEWQKKQTIDKACEWLRTHSEADYFELISVGNYCGAGNLNKKKMIEDFKKYMEE